MSIIKLMQIILNGQAFTLKAENSSLQAMLQESGYQDASFIAVAVNQVFISRSQYQEFWLKEGMEVEVVSPMEGG